MIIGVFLLIFQKKNSHLSYFDTPYLTPKIWISTLINKLTKLKNKKGNITVNKLFSFASKLSMNVGANKINHGH